MGGTGCPVERGEDFGAGVGIKLMPIKAEKEALANRPLVA